MGDAAVSNLYEVMGSFKVLICTFLKGTVARYHSSPIF